MKILLDTNLLTRMAGEEGKLEVSIDTRGFRGVRCGGGGYIQAEKNKGMQEFRFPIQVNSVENLDVGNGKKAIAPIGAAESGK